jgi:membrane protein DedA with SNARE-associated domain
MEVVSTNSVVNLLYTHRYIFSFLGAFFEGTFIMILTGVLFKLGYFKFWALMFMLFMGYFGNGITWYLLGRFGGNTILEKWGKRLHLTKNLIEKLEEYFKNHSVKTLIITRMTWGFSMLSFMTAGSLKMKFKKFLIINLVTAIAWIFALVSIGYVFGASYKALSIVTKSIRIGLTIALFAIIVLISFLIVYWLRRFARTRFIQDLSEHKESQFLRWVGEKISKFGKK